MEECIFLLPSREIRSPRSLKPRVIGSPWQQGRRRGGSSAGGCCCVPGRRTPTLLLFAVGFFLTSRCFASLFFFFRWLRLRQTLPPAVSEMSLCANYCVTTSNLKHNVSLTFSQGFCQNPSHCDVVWFYFPFFFLLLLSFYFCE